MISFKKLKYFYLYLKKIRKLKKAFSMHEHREKWNTIDTLQQDNTFN